MSSGDVRFACGCYSYDDDCRSEGGGGFCERHSADTSKMTSDEYVKHWRLIREENKGNPKNWGNA